MSGGVDSSVAASLLRSAGHEVIGVFMRHGEATATRCAIPAEPGRQDVVSGRAVATGPANSTERARSPLPIAAHKQGCCSASDAEDARRVAEQFDIPFYAIDLQAEFTRIIDYFVAEYTAARTPNPCVMCNNWIKFGRLTDYADSIGAEFVATGHYARIVHSDGGPALCRAVDPAKDQSYALFGVDRSMLARMLLPVGAYPKSEIRRMAAELGLRVADKPDSQEICFVPSGEHAEFIHRRYPGERGGEIVTTDGRVVGRHDGLERFTIGQRKGLGVAFGEPRFVVRLEPQSRRVVIGERHELARSALCADRANWLAAAPVEPRRCAAKIRYNSRPAAATVVALPDSRLRVEFDEPQYGVAPGQAVVCYDGDRVLGGGWIE